VQIPAILYVPIVLVAACVALGPISAVTHRIVAGARPEQPDRYRWRLCAATSVGALVPGMSQTMLNYVFRGASLNSDVGPRTTWEVARNWTYGGGPALIVATVAVWSAARGHTRAARWLAALAWVAAPLAGWLAFNLVAHLAGVDPDLLP